jgi:hypothetical protein
MQWPEAGTLFSNPRDTMRTSLYATLAALAVVTGITGCESSTLAYGDPTTIVTATSPAIWNKVSDQVYAALEPTVYTVREEKTFTVAYQDPTQPGWDNVQHYVHVLAVGTGKEPWMQAAVKKSKTPVDGPGLYTASDVWASGQQVTMVILSAPDSVDQFLRLLPGIHTTMDRQYRQWARNRMYMTGVDTALADTLMAKARFSLILPTVYTHTTTDSAWIFRNDNPDPSELIRQIAVTWRSPIPVGYGPEDFLKWRARLVSTYREGQVVDLSHVKEGPFKYEGHDAYQIQAVWKEPPAMNWPAAGPFIDRIITCPAQDRMYLIDAWLYAPGKDKYQYMIQLETILDTFRCGPS